MLWSFSGGNVVLHGFDAQTLAPTGSVLVPAIGPVAVSSASNVVTSGPDGDLYVAAGDAVAVVNPDNGQVIRRIYLTEGTTNSVAVSPDGSRLYVGIGGFKLVVYDLANHTVANVSSLTGTDSGGNLVATSGGVWGITGVGMSEWTWFAPSGDLGRAVRIGYGAGPASPRSPATAAAWSGSAARTRSAARARSTGRSWTPRPCPPTTAWWSTSAAPRWSAATPTPTTRTTVAAVRPGPHDPARRLLRQHQLLERDLAPGSARRNLLGRRRARRRPVAERPPAQFLAVVRGGQPDRSGPAGTIFDGFRPVCTL